MTDQTPGATTETHASGEALPSASEIMAFDPFAPASEPADKTPPGAAAPSADDKGKQSPTTTPVTPTLKAGEKPPVAIPVVDPKAAPAVPATTPTVSTANLEQLIRDQTASIHAALQPKETPDTTPPPPKYNLALPPQVLNLLRSEDQGEFAQGMHAVINGISNKIWTDVESRITEFRDKIMQDVPQLLTQQHETITTQERVANDFFGKYPSLSQPLLKPLIQSVGMQVAAIRQAAGKSVEWGDELRDEIAESIFLSLPQLRPAAGTQPAPKPGQQQQKKPLPFAAGSNARPGNAPDPTDEFTELLNL